MSFIQSRRLGQGALLAGGQRVTQSRRRPPAKRVSLSRRRPPAKRLPCTSLRQVSLIKGHDLQRTFRTSTTIIPILRPRDEPRNHWILMNVILLLPEKSIRQNGFGIVVPLPKLRFSILCSNVRKVFEAAFEPRLPTFLWILTHAAEQKFPGKTLQASHDFVDWQIPSDGN